VPVLPHLAEDIYSHSPAQIKKSYLENDFFVNGLQADNSTILLSNWPLPNTNLLNLELANSFEEIGVIRDLALKEIEQLRQTKLIGKSLESHIEISAPAETHKLLTNFQNELSSLFIVSKVELKKSDELKVVARKYEEGHKCPRCWKYFAAEEFNGALCNTCFEAVAD
jgi:isoleucyl-tRNA synthetase